MSKTSLSCINISIILYYKVFLDVFPMVSMSFFTVVTQIARSAAQILRIPRCLRRWQRSILVTQPTHPALIEARFRSIQGPKKDLGKTEKRESLKAWRGKIFIAFGRWKLSQSFWTEGEMERGRIGGLVGWETFDDRLCRLGVELRLVIWFLAVWSNNQCLEGTWLQELVDRCGICFWSSSNYVNQLQTSCHRSSIECS